MVRRNDDSAFGPFRGIVEPSMMVRTPSIRKTSAHVFEMAL